MAEKRKTFILGVAGGGSHIVTIPAKGHLSMEPNGLGSYTAVVYEGRGEKVSCGAFLNITDHRNADKVGHAFVPDLHPVEVSNEV